jgi:tetratricopeptide (TPR) repeat protein
LNSVPRRTHPEICGRAYRQGARRHARTADLVAAQRRSVAWPSCGLVSEALSLQGSFVWGQLPRRACPFIGCALLELGRWYLAQQDWARGAGYLDAYVKRGDADWEAYFALGVAYANMRQGERTDRAALDAYDEAMRRVPADLPPDMAARLYSHRSGMKKRLGLLGDAKADAEIASQLAQQRYEQVDAIYNLACIEAMLGNRDAAIAHIAELSRLGAVRLVRGHLHDYFRSLLADPEFRALVGITGPQA